MCCFFFSGRSRHSRCALVTVFRRVLFRSLGRNIGAFTLQDLLPHADADGRVTITVGPEENGSGPLHLRTEPGRIQIYTRDSQSDWAQVPAEVTVRRLDPPVDWRSRTEDRKSTRLNSSH